MLPAAEVISCFSCDWKRGRSTAGWEFLISDPALWLQEKFGADDYDG